MMNDTCTFFIELAGQVDSDEINAATPVQMVVDRVEMAATRLMVCTDQSGLVGLLRYLHGRGFVLVSVNREPGGQAG